MLATTCLDKGSKGKSKSPRIEHMGYTTIEGEIARQLTDKLLRGESLLASQHTMDEVIASARQAVDCWAVQEPHRGPPDDTRSRVG